MEVDCILCLGKQAPAAALCDNKLFFLAQRLATGLRYLGCDCRVLFRYFSKPVNIKIGCQPYDKGGEIFHTI